MDTNLREWKMRNFCYVLRYNVAKIVSYFHPYSYELSDGVSRQEQGELKQIGTEQALVVRGSVSWVAADGQTYTLNYVADENGYQPEGDFLPKA